MSVFYYYSLLLYIYIYIFLTPNVLSEKQNGARKLMEGNKEGG